MWDYRFAGGSHPFGRTKLGLDLSFTVLHNVEEASAYHVLPQLDYSNHS